MVTWLNVSLRPASSVFRGDPSFNFDGKCFLLEFCHRRERMFPLQETQVEDGPYTRGFTVG